MSMTDFLKAPYVGVCEAGQTTAKFEIPATFTGRDLAVNSNLIAQEGYDPAKAKFIVPSCSPNQFEEQFYRLAKGVKRSFVENPYIFLRHSWLHGLHETALDLNFQPITKYNAVTGLVYLGALAHAGDYYCKSPHWDAIRLHNKPVDPRKETHIYYAKRLVDLSCSDPAVAFYQEYHGNNFVTMNCCPSLGPELDKAYFQAADLQAMEYEEK